MIGERLSRPATGGLFSLSTTGHKMGATPTNGHHRKTWAHSYPAKDRRTLRPTRSSYAKLLSTIIPHLEPASPERPGIMLSNWYAEKVIQPTVCPGQTCPMNNE